jgi:RimK family alpha-L-glutamate ligase
MKKALILINAYMHLPAQMAQAERIRTELEALGVETDVLRNDGFFARIDGEEIVLNLPKVYDFCVYLDKDKYVSQMLEQAGVKLFNCHQAIRDCDDKMQTYIKLSGCGIPMAKTLPGLLCYSPEERVKEATLERIERILGYPVIVKECFGSLGKGVHMARNREELMALAEQLKMQPHLFQETIKTSVGKDMRVIVVGGKVLCAMLRSSESDFRSNIELGGKATPCSPDAAVIAVCERVAKLLSLAYCGIDILFGERGNPIVCEVNSNAFFGGMERVTGVNVAKAYAEHMLKVTQEKGEEYAKD